MKVTAIGRSCRIFQAVLLLLPATSSAATVWLPVTQEAVPEILGAERTPSGFSLEMAAPPGAYTFQRSLTLAGGSWQNLGIINPVSGVGAALDPAALTLPAAFYRVAGGFQETPMQLIAFDSTLSSTTFTSPPDVFVWGGMWTRQSRENLLYQRTNPDNGLFKLLGGESGSFLVEPTNFFKVFTSVEQWNDIETFPLATTASQWVVDVEGGVTLIPAEGGNHSLVGIYRQDEETYGDENFTSTDRSLETLWAIARSQDANPADLAGEWGFVRILIDAFDSDGIYSGLTFATSIAAGPNPRSFSINSIDEFEILHLWPTDTEPTGVFPDFFSETLNPPLVPQLSLASDGEVVITVPGEDGDEVFKGMVSPSAKLVVATSSVPNIDDNPGNEPGDFGSVQYLVGVKRAINPQLAGKTYRVIRHGWWVEGDFFEVERSGTGAKLVFNANGTMVTRTEQVSSDFVSFDGVFGNASFSDNVNIPVSVNGGQILMELSEPGFSLKTYGFAQEGSGLLVLVDSIEDGNGAGLGLIIAIEQP
jgi:hypothetical protein